MNVGAIIDRPAVHSYLFAQFPANSLRFTARAINDRPYNIVVTLCDKHHLKYSPFANHCIHKKSMKVGTSFSQSASQWPPPTWQWSISAAPDASA